MTEEQRQWLWTRLEEQREEVLKDLEGQRTSDRSGGDDERDDLADRAELELERALEHRRENDDSHLLQKINHALKRLEEGNHEICDGCQAIIDWERLEARPYVCLCHTCQQAKENGQTVEQQR
jgi:DnaK suppressor protein